MQALVLVEVGRFEVVDLPDPQPGSGEVRIRVTQSGICGSELGGFRGTDGLRRPGLVFGHELIGTVDAYGPDAPADRLAVGTVVTVNPLRSCGRCRICRSGRPNVCPLRQLLGGHLNGSNAELVVVDVGSVHPIGGERVAMAILAEPTACALRAVRRSSVEAGGSALVIGAGPIGLLLLEVLRLNGVETLLFTERMDGRVPAAEASGGRRLPDDDDERLLEEVQELTGGFGVDVVFDAVGSSQTRRSAVRAVRPGGDVCLVGLHTGESTLPVRDLIRREVACVTSFAYTPDDFADAVGLLGSGQARFHAEIAHARLADGQAWYERLIAGHPAGKVVLEPARGLS